MFFQSVRSIAGRRQPPPMGSSSSRALQQACRHLQVVSQSADTRSLAPFEERGGYLRRQYISPLLESNFLSIMAGAPHSPPPPAAHQTHFFIDPRITACSLATQYFIISRPITYRSGNVFIFLQNNTHLFFGWGWEGVANGVNCSLLQKGPLPINLRHIQSRPGAFCQLTPFLISF